MCPEHSADIFSLPQIRNLGLQEFYNSDAVPVFDHPKWNFGGHSVPAAAIEAHHAAFGMLGMFEGAAGGPGVFEELEVAAASAALESLQRSELSVSANAQSQRDRRKAPKGKRKAELEDDAQYNPPKRRKGGDNGGNAGGDTLFHKDKINIISNSLIECF
ncbi:hypothetical protein BDR26DRAFT_921182 [Obelidium mucronatum]|nr:hypothetical protein BDR26DRAFT_921182 [Obelidium mucronatum]